MPNKMFGSRRATKTQKAEKKSMLFSLEAELEEDSSFKDAFIIANKQIKGQVKRFARVSMLVVDFMKLIR